jgi:hypothetical protein
MFKKLETKWSLGSINHNKIIRELQTWFDCVCTWDLSGTQFSTLYSAGINNPEGPEKYNNTEVK